MTAVPLDDLRRPDFEHTLCLLPPTQYPGGDTRWFAYLDDPSRWHRSFTTVSGMLQAAGTLLVKLSDFERSTVPITRGQHNPNCIAGTASPVPNIPPKWVVLVGASYSEEKIEWWLELQDESAWREEGYDLQGLLATLERRISAARVPTQVALSTVPVPRIEHAPTAPTPSTPHASSSVPAASGGFVKVVRDEMARLDAEIARHQSAIAGVERKMDALKQERRGLTAALSVYEKHSRKADS